MKRARWYFIMTNNRVVANISLGVGEETGLENKMNMLSWRIVSNNKGWTAANDLFLDSTATMRASFQLAQDEGFPDEG